MRSCLNLLVWLLLNFAISARAATYEVAQRNPRASDDSDGSAARPWKSLAPAGAKVSPGDRVIIHDGIYRESVLIKTSGTESAPILFTAAPGAHVVLTGADQLTGWQKSSGSPPIYQVPWPHRFVGWSKNMTHPDDDYHRLIGRCEQVAIDGYLLRQVLESRQLAPGTFFADTSNQFLQVWDTGSRDLNKVYAEASSRQEIFNVEGAFVQIRGLHFRFAANMAQHGAVILAGAHDSLEDCTIEDMNSSGATFSAEHLIVHRCVFRNNGQLGFGANAAHDLLFTECLVENNNTKSFDRGWEAGGDKLVLCRNAVLERSQFLNNRGNGIWFDIGNEHCTVRQCLIADNEDSGIFNEISYGLQVRDNVIIGNGFAATGGAWGAQAGISLSSSPDALIERNLIVGNREGFNFREQTRTTSRIGGGKDEPIWNHDETIIHNVIADNRDAQVWGWFDMHDGRHWPTKTANSAVQDSPAPANIAGPYTAKSADSQPQGLTLEKLHLNFADNIYYAAAGQTFVGWGVTWAKHETYSNLEDFQSALNLDHGSRSLDPDFADLNARDFRVTPQTMEVLKSDYPNGPVPNVILGISQ